MVLSPVDKLRTKFSLPNGHLKNFLSELFGTWFLVFVGTSVVASYVLANDSKHTFLQVNFGWGLALAFAVYATYKSSGGHLNPVVSLAFLTLGKMKAVSFVVYFVGQMIGGFVGSACTYLLHYDKIAMLGEATFKHASKTSTIGLFTSSMAPHMSLCGAAFDHFIGSAFLILCIIIITENRTKIPSSAQPLLIGLSLVMIGTAFGFNLGYSINPARELMGRIFACIAGYQNAFSHGGHYWWTVILAQYVGGVFGAWIYYLFIGCHINETEHYTEVPMTIVKTTTIRDPATEPLTKADHNA